MLRISSTVMEAVVPCDLTYNIASGLLNGTVDGVSLSAYAGSGGRAGTRSVDGLEWWLANNPFATHVALPADKRHAGGPIPYGKYRVVEHESRLNWLRLLPLDPSRMHGRSGFAIHGRGARGSDGCLVPTDFSVVRQLVGLARARRERGAPAIRLMVVAVGTDLDRKVRTA